MEEKRERTMPKKECTLALKVSRQQPVPQNRTTGEWRGCQPVAGYKAYSELKWNKNSTLLDDPVKATDIDNTESHFLEFMLLAEKENVPWFLVSRQCGLSDSNLQRCINQFKQRYMYVSLPNNQRVDLGILEHLIQINKFQLNNRLPESKPILTMHTARLMRQLYVLHQKHPSLTVPTGRRRATVQRHSGTGFRRSTQPSEKVVDTLGASCWKRRTK